MKDLKKRFPDVWFVDITKYFDNTDDLWINVTEPRYEERENELIEFFGEKAADILMDYGDHISVMPIR